MFRKLALLAIAGITLTGCVTDGTYYGGGYGGDYYTRSGYYGASGPCTSIGYGSRGGWYGSIGYGGRYRSPYGGYYDPYGYYGSYDRYGYGYDRYGYDRYGYDRFGCDDRYGYGYGGYPYGGYYYPGYDGYANPYWYPPVVIVRPNVPDNRPRPVPPRDSDQVLRLPREQPHDRIRMMDAPISTPSTFPRAEYRGRPEAVESPEPRFERMEPRFEQRMERRSEGFEARVEPQIQPRIQRIEPRPEPRQQSFNTGVERSERIEMRAEPRIQAEDRPNRRRDKDEPR